MYAHRFALETAMAGYGFGFERVMNCAIGEVMSITKPIAPLLAELEDLLGPVGFTTDPHDLAPWLTDWRERITGSALALVSPATVEQVSAVVKLAAAYAVAIVPQGGNTSMVAGAVPHGRALLLSLRRMRAIRRLSPEDNVTICEAGVILSDLHDAAAAIDRRFPLSLGAKGSATIGGLISTNAGGTQVLRFGNMRAQLLGIEAVLPDGQIFSGLAGLRKDNRGYDLAQLLAGAEGTLGVVTAAALRLVPAFAARSVAWVGLDSPEHALSLLRMLEQQLGDAVEGFELVPDSALQLVLKHIPGQRAPLASQPAWNVLIETTAPAGAPDPNERLEAALATAFEQGLVSDATLAANEAQATALWTLRENISEAERQQGGSVKHDISVPISQIATFMAETGPALAGHFGGASVISFGHLGDGNLHYNVLPPEGVVAKQWLDSHWDVVNRFVHDRVSACGGSLSAEHGIGEMKLAEFARTADPARLAALRAIKAALDPTGMMNPGKLVPLALN
jgi:FAD/FMN-containing dehydrogenase